MRIKPALLIFMLSVALLWGCTARSLSIPVEKDSLFEVYLERQMGKSGKPMDKGYQHPAMLSTEDIGGILQSVRIKHDPGVLQRLIMGPGKDPERAFSDDEIDRMAPGISQALLRAGPADQVGFLLRHPRGIFGPKLTTGVVFIKENRFRIILGNYKYIPPPGGLADYDDFQSPLETKNAQVFALIPGSFQEFAAEGSRQLRRRTLIIDYQGLLSARVEEPGPAGGEKPPAAQPPTLKQTLEEKLRQLKRLYDQELISEEEYRDKKKQLLEDF